MRFQFLQLTLNVILHINMFSSCTDPNRTNRYVCSHWIKTHYGGNCSFYESIMSHGLQTITWDYPWVVKPAFMKEPAADPEPSKRCFPYKSLRRVYSEEHGGCVVHPHTTDTDLFMWMTSNDLPEDRSSTAPKSKHHQWTMSFFILQVDKWTSSGETSSLMAVTMFPMILW